MEVPARRVPFPDIRCARTIDEARPWKRALARCHTNRTECEVARRRPRSPSHGAARAIRKLRKTREVVEKHSVGQGSRILDRGATHRAGENLPFLFPLSRMTDSCSSSPARLRSSSSRGTSQGRHSDCQSRSPARRTRSFPLIDTARRLAPRSLRGRRQALRRRNAGRRPADWVSRTAAGNGRRMQACRTSPEGRAGALGE